MTQILKSYFFRLVRFKPFYILIGIVFFYTLIYAWIMAGVNGSINEGRTLLYTASDIIVPLLNPFNTPMLASFLFIVIFIGHDWKNDTFRNYILAGKSRYEIYFSALIMSLILYGMFFVAVLLPASFFAIVYPTKQSPDFIYIFYSWSIIFVTGVTFAVISFFFTMLIHGKGAIGAIIGIILVIPVFSTLLELLEAVQVLAPLPAPISLYEFKELLWGYQTSQAAGNVFSGNSLPTVDIATKYVYVQNDNNSYITTEVVTGRGVILFAKSLIKDAIVIGGLLPLGAMQFNKTDLR